MKRRKCEDAGVKDKHNINTESSASMLRLLNGITNRCSDDLDPRCYGFDKGVSPAIHELATPFSTMDTENIKHIIVNSAKLNHNLRIIKCLSNETNHDIIEQGLSSGCDFVLNTSICSMRIEPEKFLQMNGRGTLYYERDISLLILEFTRVIVLV